MNNDSEFLTDIYRATRMGAETLDNLLSKTDGSKIEDELMREKRVYREFQNKTDKIIKERNESPKPINKAQKRMAKMGIDMNIMFDRSDSHLADIVIQGNNMGIIGMSKTINSHKNADEDISDLAYELVDIQRKNIDNLLKFL